MKKISALMLLPLLLQCSLFQVAGTTDETMSGNKVAAMVYNEDGTPAVGATVKFFQHGTTNLALKTETDSNGRYDYSGLNGTYSILTSKSSRVSFQDSAFIFPDTGYLKADTLREPGTFTAQVGLRPGDNYQSVTAEILGTDLFANVDAKGKLTLSGLAEGGYRLRLSTTMANYTTTYFPIGVKRDSANNHPDTLWMIYSGIPIVAGLRAAYDTLDGVMVVTWNSSDYFNFQEYLLFRQDDTSKAIPTLPLKVLTDTLFRDTIYDFENRFGDTNSYSYQYRVKIRDKFDREGNVFGFIRATASPPALVRTAFEFGLPGNQSDTLTRNDTIRLSVGLQNKTRALRSISWAVGKIDSVVKDSDLDTTRKTARDTLEYSWTTEGEYWVYAISRDISGVEWIDSTRVYVVKDYPRITIAKDTLVLTNSRINLHATAAFRYSRISKWEWDIGNTGNFIQVSTSDTVITAPSTEQQEYLCVLRATNEDGIGSLDTMKIQTRKVFILAPAGNAGVSGIYRVHGLADPTVSEVRVRLDGNGWVTASGTDSWSADIETRMSYPTVLSNISIQAYESGNNVFQADVPIALQNPDPLIGCWSGDATFCLFENGNISGSPLGVGWNFPYGWMRNTATSVTVLKQFSGNAVVDIQWVDYNTLKTSGATTGTYTRQ